MRRCKKCVMPDTRPGSVFDKEGVCLACRNYEKRSQVDWDARFQELAELCEQYRRNDGYYDCVIAVSGGKDSYFILHTIKGQLGMNPLLITVANPFTKTRAGEFNLANLMEVFGCDHMMLTINPNFIKRQIKSDFEQFGEPLRFIESAIYIQPPKLARQFGIPLVFYGENAGYDYGTTDVESPIRPNEDADVRYLGYYVPWESTHHLAVAQKYGFRDLANEWVRDGCSENFEQIDSFGYMAHIWMKYPKFSFQRVSDIESRRIREGLQTREEAMVLVEKYDHKLDRRALDDFVGTLGYTHSEFWNIVEKWNKYL